MRGKSVNEDVQEEVDDALNNSVGSVTTSSGNFSSSSSSSFSSSSTTNIKQKEDWEKWYPMEWISWVIFGPASDEPTEHWVNEAIDDGPETNESKRKPNGRVDQRRKENDTKASTKVQIETNALRVESVEILKHDKTISERDEDIKKVAFFMQFSKTPAAIVSTIRVL